MNAIKQPIVCCVLDLPTQLVKRTLLWLSLCINTIRSQFIQLLNAQINEEPHHGPQHVVFGQVIPSHFINASLEDVLKVLIHWLSNQPRYPQLVDIERCRVSIIEHHGVPQVVVGWPVECLHSLQACSNKRSLPW